MKKEQETQSNKSLTAECTIQNVVMRYSLDEELIETIPRLMELGYKIKNGGINHEEYEEYCYLKDEFEELFM